MNFKAAFLAMAAASAFAFVAGCGGGSAGDSGQSQPSSGDGSNSGGGNSAGGGGTSTASGNASCPPQTFTVAPQLRVVQDGPVVATFLGMGAGVVGTPGLSFVTSANLSLSVFSFPFGATGLPIPGSTAQLGGFSAGTDITITGQFNTAPAGSSMFNLVNSSTGATPAVAAFLGSPGIFGTQTLLFNAGVMPAASAVQIGFTPSGSAPSKFDDFMLRISVSNVNFAGSGC